MGFCVFSILLISTLLFTKFNSKDPSEMVGSLYEPPSREHILGTDNFGKDVFVVTFQGLVPSLGFRESK